MRTSGLVILVVFWTGGCATSEVDMVRKQAAAAFNCDAHDVTVRERGEPDPETTDYEASACGTVALYRCTRGYADELGSKGAPRAPHPTIACSASSASPAR